MNDSADEINANHRVGNNKTTISKYFEYKTKIIGKTPADDDTLHKEVVVQLKSLSNFWTSLDSP